jgi:hypothetical protein
MRVLRDPSAEPGRAGVVCRIVETARRAGSACWREPAERDPDTNSDTGAYNLSN